MRIKLFEAYINESMRDTLYIFDFDETLVLNNSFEHLAIQYLKEDVTIKSLLTSSIRKIGVAMKDLKWENGRIFVDDENEDINVGGNWVRKGKRVYLVAPDKFYYTDMSFPYDVTNLKELYNRVDNKAIVTGRVDSVRQKVIDSLDKFGLDYPNHGLFCYPSNRQTSDRVAQWKARTIVELIKETGFKRVFFYDDRAKWVNKVTAAVKKELPYIDWNPVKFNYKKAEILEKCNTLEDTRLYYRVEETDVSNIVCFTKADERILGEIGFKIDDCDNGFKVNNYLLYKSWYRRYNRYFIFKSNDEWFYISGIILGRIIFYKCDQLDGLYQCLKNEFGFTFITPD